MKRLILLVALIAALIAPSIAGAGTFLPHKPHLTKLERVHYFERSLHKDKTALAWLRSHEAPRTLERVSEIRWYTAARRWHTQLLADARSKLEPAWPAHHLLWLCIHGTPALGTEVGHEAASWSNRDTGGNGHYGGLQMHENWGHGTSRYASDDSQLTQELAAEDGYSDSGYSRSFLIQQWGQTIGPCWRYA